MKTYSLEFNVLALKEWQKLDNSVRSQFKKQLEKRIQNPRTASAKLHGDLDNFYKIKLAALGYRLVYEVIDQTYRSYYCGWQAKSVSRLQRSWKKKIVT